MSNKSYNGEFFTRKARRFEYYEVGGLVVEMRERVKEERRGGRGVRGS